MLLLAISQNESITWGDLLIILAVIALLVIIFGWRFRR